MRCDCCLRKKGLFEVFETVQYEAQCINLCVDCCKQIYKVRDAQKFGKAEDVQALMNEVLNKKSSATFNSWFAANYLQKGEPPKSE